jgi:hypothetical protein
MNVEDVTPILNVSSLEKSFAWFEQLGWIHSSLIADCRLAISRLTIDD